MCFISVIYKTGVGFVDWNFVNHSQLSNAPDSLKTFRLSIS